MVYLGGLVMLLKERAKTDNWLWEAGGASKGGCSKFMM